MPNFATLYPGFEPNNPSINAPIELGIRPICDALNSIPGVHTLWSCEGHPAQSALPYVVFIATQETAYKISSLVEYINSGLKYNWVLTANFRSDGSLQYKLAPSDVRISDTRWWLFHWLRRKSMVNDLVRIESLLAQLKS